jgi:hypothetical protein
MKLYDLFSWMLEQTQVLPEVEELCTEARCELELACVKKQRDILIPELRVAHFGKARDKAAQLQAQIHFHDAYLNFLKLCEQILKSDSTTHPYALALSYLSSKEFKALECQTKDGIKAKLFFAFLKVQKEAAVAFYYKNREQFAGIKNLEQAIVVENHLANLTLFLSPEQNPMGITPLFRSFVDDTERYVSVILWLLKRRVLVEEILEFNLLQNFMAYHLAWVGTEVSQLTSFYELLAMFPETQELMTAAYGVRTEERGFYSEEEGAHSFNIVGAKCENSTLRRVTTRLPSLRFTPTPANVFGLYQLFEVDFLTPAVVWCVRHHHPDWQGALKELLNREDVVKGPLALLIQRIANNCSPLIIETLASLIDDDNLHRMLKYRKWAVLHFLPFKPTLRTHIDQENMADFLQQLTSDNAAFMDVIPALVVLLNTFCGVNESNAILVYEALIELVLCHPECFDDDDLNRELRKFKGYATILLKQEERLLKVFDDCLNEAVMITPITQASYYRVEDSWLETSRKLSALKQIAPRVIKGSVGDKYNMQVDVLLRYFSLHPEAFHLDDLMSTFGITLEVLSEDVTECHRLLVELLCSIDNDKVRQDILKILTPCAGWNEKKYGERSLLNRAVAKGNLGLVRWLGGRNLFKRDEIAEAIPLAASLRCWPIIEYFCTSPAHKPQQMHLRELLPIAAGDGQFDLVKLLCERNIKHLTERSVVMAFMRAAESDHTEIVRFLSKLDSHPPSDTIKAKTLKTAVRAECFNVVDFLGNLPHNAIITAAVEHALFYEVMHDRLPAVERLCRLETNTPRLSKMEDAFVSAIRYGHVRIAGFLSHLPNITLGQQTFNAALSVAMVQGSLSSVVFLCSEERGCPSVHAREQAVLKAVKLNRPDLLRIVCFSNGKLREDVKIEAMMKATKAGYLQIVEHFIPMTSPHLLNQTFHMAAQYGQLNVMRLLAKHCPPTRASILIALQKASLNVQDRVISYLHLLLSATSFRGEISSRDMGLKKSTSLSSLVSQGIFRPRRFSSVSEYKASGPNLVA